MSRLFDRHRRTHPQERKLRDDELVTAGNAYLADREGIVSQWTCTVGALKERLNVSEIRAMGFAERVLAPLYEPADRPRLRALALASVARGVATGFRAALAVPRG
jgi:hypothetical protein